ncbi:DNA fragmentation factor subunit alpha [Pristis pectinata]|uniref:DNA fragmentation factor subunit alpha n=1 Tax=Pristis pectinata TaxID=685728 RepID=UPI00223CA047|nr:DNA fragmentation factor subunit alpha [Pristis pectinata]
MAAVPTGRCPGLGVLVGSSGRQRPRMQQSFACKICGLSRRQTFGVVVGSLQELLAKGINKLGLDKRGAQWTCTVVLEEDGTAVDDEDYFEQLPKNTKFMILGPGEKWISRNVEMKLVFGTRTNADIGDSRDCVDYAGSSSNWKILANRLRQNLAQIITMSESDLQTLIDAPSAELAKELGVTSDNAEEIQDFLQRALDTSEDRRQAIELLKLYRNVCEKDGMKLGLDTRTNSDIGDSVDCVDYTKSSSNWRILANQLEQNIAQIITMSESDLRALINVPSNALAKELGVTSKNAEEIHDALQRALDTREERRQAIELLKLYRNVCEEDDSTLAQKTEVDSFDAVTSQTTQLSQHIIEVLRKKSCPELSLSTRELQEVFKEKQRNLTSALQCSTAKVKKLQQDCKKEFEKRSTTVDSLEQLNKYSSRKRKL